MKPGENADKVIFIKTYKGQWIVASTLLPEQTILVSESKGAQLERIFQRILLSENRKARTKHP